MIFELAETARFFPQCKNPDDLASILQDSVYVGQASARSNLQELCKIHARSCKTFLYGKQHALVII